MGEKRKKKREQKSWVLNKCVLRVGKEKHMNNNNKKEKKSEIAYEGEKCLNRFSMNTARGGYA